MASLITNTTVRSLVMNDSNFTVTLMPEEFIYNAQRIHIKPFLRAEFYDHIILNSGSYSTLLTGGSYTYGSYTYSFEGLQYAIAWATLIESLPFIQIQIRNSGVRVNNAEHSAPASDSQFGYIMDFARKKFNYYIDSCIDYLNRNTSTYTLWTSKGVQYKIVGGVIIPNRHTTIDPEDPSNWR